MMEKMHSDSRTCKPRCPQVSKIEAGQGADYGAMPCRRCGGTFVEMKDLLYHRCGQPAQSKRTRPKGRKNRVGVKRA